MKKHRVKYSSLISLLLLAALALSACGGGAPQEAGAASTADAADRVEAPADGAPEYYGDDAVPRESVQAPDSAHSESYLVIDENKTRYTDAESVVTLSLKVDTAAYTNVARYIESGNPPPADAVRTEELINYFSYENSPAFTEGAPFALYTEVAPSPLNPAKHMAFIRVATREAEKSELPPSSLTFLIDTSGSMDSYDKLPLLKEAFSLLVDTLGEDDRVSIATYAGSAGVVLDGASGADKSAILSAIERLTPLGSTAGEAGIQTAYALAEKNFRRGGNNRVILATDGDFNVGASDTGALAALVSEKRESGVYLSVLGFGTGNLRDDIMETLSKNGAGNYAYINTVATARKVLVEELGSNLYTAAEDVKAQVEFNPANVASYRLIGYENRRLRNEDFADDRKDAGEIGVGTDVVLLFELELRGDSSGERKKYADAAPSSATYGDELFELRVRYKDPGAAESRLLTRPVSTADIARNPGSDFRFACSVAAFGELLRGSEYARGLSVQDIASLAGDSLGQDPGGYRREHLVLLGEYNSQIG